jgi:ABC-2 type transport system permease protein
MSKHALGVVTPGSTLTGTAELVRQAARRDRIVVPISLALFVLMAYASAYATGSLYHSGADQMKAITLINGQRGIVALYGPVDPTAGVGALAMSKMTVLYALFAAGVFVGLVRRHTRVEEESGRTEFLAGASVGRNAPLFAAVVGASGVAVALGVLVGLAAIIGGLPVQGSVYFGLSWIGTGLVATGVGAVCCQLFPSARTCAAAAAGVLGATFIVRAIGDATTLHWLDWLSPLGWNVQLNAWSHPRAWVVPLYVVLAGALLAVAQWLRSHRDLGSGVVPTRSGALAGSRRLRGPASLELRLHRSMLVLWSTAVFASCVFFGAITPSLNGILKTVGGERLKADLGGSLIVAILSEFAVIVSCFAVVVVSHASSEELGGRSELAFSTPQSRIRWLGACAGLATAGTTWLMVLAGAGMWLGDAMGGGSNAIGGFWGALVWVPAILIVCGLSLVLWVIRPSWAPAAWIWPFGFWLLSLVPPLFHAPGWVAGLSPFHHVPAVPTGPMDWSAEIVMLVVAGALVAGAVLRFRSRDIG